MTSAPDLGDVVALVGAITALVVAVTGCLVQLRLMRRDIVDAVEAHKNETIAVIREQQKVDTEDG